MGDFVAGSQQPTWQVAYRAREEYSLSDMSAASWSGLAERLLAPNSTIFPTYCNHYWGQNPEAACSMKNAQWEIACQLLVRPVLTLCVLMRVLRRPRAVR
jgi:hypothetical protein